MKRLVVLATLLVGGPALAYVIPADSVFARFAAKQALEKIDGAPLAGRARLFVNGEEKRGQAQVLVDAPGQCVLSLELPETMAKATLAKGQVTTDGADVPALEALAALGCPLTTLKATPAQDAEARLRRMASTLGINTKVVSLRQFDGRPAWVVGAKPLDVSSPQIWFEKESNRPVRIIAVHDGVTWDVRFAGVRSLATGRRHPRVAEVWQGDRQVLSLRLMTAVDTAPVAEEAADEEEAPPEE